MAATSCNRLYNILMVFTTLEENNTDSDGDVRGALLIFPLCNQALAV